MNGVWSARRRHSSAPARASPRPRSKTKRADAAARGRSQRDASGFYPPIKPYQRGYLRVIESCIRLYYPEQSSANEAKPVVFL